MELISFPRLILHPNPQGHQLHHFEVSSKNLGVCEIHPANQAEQLRAWLWNLLHPGWKPDSATCQRWPRASYISLRCHIHLQNRNSSYLSYWGAIWFNHGEMCERLSTALDTEIGHSRWDSLLLPMPWTLGMSFLSGLLKHCIMSLESISWQKTDQISSQLHDSLKKTLCRTHSLICKM